MFSACYARLISAFSGYKLQAIISSKIDKTDCLKWAKEITKDDYFNDIISVHPIHRRLLEEPEFMVGELYYGEIKNLTVSFVSRLEFFLRDSMQLNMMRNYSLFKKALVESGIVVDSLDIVKFDDIETIRLKYIKYISNKMCSGELWSEKLKKYIKVLSLSKDLNGEAVNKKVDSIWKMRNDISHANTNTISFEYNGSVYKYDSNIKVDEYIKFALIFIELVDECAKFLEKVDRLSLEKWKVTDVSMI